MMKAESEARPILKSVSLNTLLSDSLQLELSSKELGSVVEGLSSNLATTLTLDLSHNLSELLPCPHL